MEVHVNLLAVFVAMLSSLVIGSIWYAPPVFGNAWRKLGRIEGDGGSVLRPIAITVVVSLITAYVLAHVAFLSHHFFNNSFLQDSVTTAFWMWLGFTAARFVTHDAFESRPVTLTAINISLEFVTLMVMGLIIGLIGV